MHVFSAGAVAIGAAANFGAGARGFGGCGASTLDNAVGAAPVLLIVRFVQVPPLVFLVGGVSVDASVCVVDWLARLLCFVLSCLFCLLV